MTGKNQSLELMKAMAELAEGFQEVAPLMADMIENCRQAASGEDPSGYIRMMQLVNAASEEYKEMLLLLMTQWIATVKVGAARDENLRALLAPLFGHSKILGKM